MANFVERTLTYLNQKGAQERIRDSEVALIPEPVIVLGEPGMGKTELLKQIGDFPNMVFKSAAAFVAHPNPAALVQPVQRLIIDGLDELPASQESDPVYRVLGKLIEAGSPSFILSCRAADWRGAIARQEIEEEYRTPPREVTLEPLSRESAVKLLSASLSSERAEQIVERLEAKGVSDLYGNPLTLGLFGKIDISGGDLPITRAALFDRACSIMWNEGNDRHVNSPLSCLDKDAALTAAGAACAALVLTGCDTVSLKPANLPEPGTVHFSELRALPGGENVRHLVGSRLFRRFPGGDDHFQPIHRLIAEFLGARWLAAAVKNDQARKRILALITCDGGVPASLRGVHAWLPHFDRWFARLVIAADPYGLLRYGDADGLSVGEGRILLQSLKRLQDANPFFRAEDWTRHSANGLTHEELRGDIRDILLANDTTFHLRTLILEAIRGSAVAATLSDDLHAIMLNEGDLSFSFAEREDAAEAIISLGHGTNDWPAIIKRLNQISDEDSTRLALDIMGGVGYERFSAERIADTVLAHLGMLHERDAAQAERQVGDALFFVVRRLPDTQLVDVLDALVTRLPFLPADTVWHERSELADLVMRLIARQIEIAAPDPLKLLAWLRIAQGGLVSDESRRVTTFIQTNDGVRRTIQWHVLFVEHYQEKAWDRIWRMSEIDRALMPSADDAICFLEKLAALPEPTSDEEEVWRELAAFARRHKESAEDMLEAAHPFAVGKPELESYLAELSKPLPPTEWELKDAERRRQNESEKAEAWAKARKNFSENEAALRSGELRWCFPVSQAYLGLFRDSNRSLPPPERIGEWLGELHVAALVGLEAVLTRPDIPTLQQVADSYAKSQRWNFVHPLIAAVAERIRTNRGLSDLTRDVVATVRLALHHELLGDRIDSDAVAKHLDAELRRDPALYERYIRLLIEPSLQKRQTRIPGLYAFVRTPEDRELASRLSKEWLTLYADLPVEVELELLDALADANEFETLQRLASLRAEHGYADDEHRRNWQALGMLVDFDATATTFGEIRDEEKDFLWHIRHRLRGDRFQSRPTPTVTVQLSAWVIRQFRHLWPYTESPNYSWGNTNNWDATDFLQFLIKRLGSDPTEAAGIELAALIADREDEYSPFLRHAAAQQRRVRREINFPGVTIEQLMSVIEDRAPQSTRDLLAIIRYALERLQSELRGSDTDAIAKYYQDNGRPRIEDWCTDRLIEDIQRLLPPYGIERIPQRDMPAGKCADIVFTIGELELPVECKGQWHKDLWTAACTQLDTLYLRSWRSQDTGLYIVYWFGPHVAREKRLQAPPPGVPTPTTAAELRTLLIERLPPERRGSIAVEVLDLTR